MAGSSTKQAGAPSWSARHRFTAPRPGGGGRGVDSADPQAGRLPIRHGSGSGMTETGGVRFGRAELEQAFTALGERLVRRGVVADGPDTREPAGAITGFPRKQTARRKETLRRRPFSLRQAAIFRSNRTRHNRHITPQAGIPHSGPPGSAPPARRSDPPSLRKPRNRQSARLLRPQPRPSMPGITTQVGSPAPWLGQAVRAPQMLAASKLLVGIVGQGRSAEKNPRMSLTSRPGSWWAA